MEKSGLCLSFGRRRFGVFFFFSLLLLLSGWVSSAVRVGVSRLSSSFAGFLLFVIGDADSRVVSGEVDIFRSCGAVGHLVNFLL